MSFQQTLPNSVDLQYWSWEFLRFRPTALHPHHIKPQKANSIWPFYPNKAPDSISLPNVHTPSLSLPWRDHLLVQPQSPQAARRLTRLRLPSKPSRLHRLPQPPPSSDTHPPHRQHGVVVVLTRSPPLSPPPLSRPAQAPNLPVPQPRPPSPPSHVNQQSKYSPPHHDHRRRSIQRFLPSAWPPPGSLQSPRHPGTTAVTHSAQLTAHRKHDSGVVVHQAAAVWAVD